MPGLDRLKSLPDDWSALTNLDLVLPQGPREIDQVVYFFREVVGVAAVTKEVLSGRTGDYQGWVEAFARNPEVPIEWAEKGCARKSMSGAGNTRWSGGSALVCTSSCTSKKHYIHVIPVHLQEHGARAELPVYGPEVSDQRPESPHPRTAA
jgi:hypothetical protein